MRLRLSFLAASVLAGLVLSGSFEESVAAQYGRRANDALQLPWENDRFRLTRIAVEPGATLSDGADRVLVYLTAGPDGLMPPAAAVWQPAGSGGLENRGGAPLEAIAIELKDVSTAAAGGTPPEALSAARGASYRHASYGASYRVAASRLIDNSRVLVMKHRYAPTTYVDPLHFHSEDLLVVYLRGGYTWPAGGRWGANRVQRGEVDVIPANTLHTLGNAGSDPLEFLVIIPR